MMCAVTGLDPGGEKKRNNDFSACRCFGLGLGAIGVYDVSRATRDTASTGPEWFAIYFYSHDIYARLASDFSGRGDYDD